MLQHMDLLQFMIDATAEGEEGEGMKNKLTDSQIIGNAITFMLAGYETTANALSYTSYLLAINPHVQEKLQEEIDTYLEENPVIKGTRCNLWWIPPSVWHRRPLHTKQHRT